MSLPLTARLPNAALAARCTSWSWLVNRYKTGSSVSLPTSRTSFSVISAKASAADRCRSTLSEKERVVKAARGEPVKKLVVFRSGISNAHTVSEKLNDVYAPAIRLTFEVL